MANNKTLKERIEILNQLIEKEPIKVNDIINSGKAILKQLSKPVNKKELETDYFTSMRENINNYMSHTTLSDTQKEDVVKINATLKALNNSGLNSSKKQSSEESSKTYEKNSSNQPIQQQTKSPVAKNSASNLNKLEENINNSFTKLSAQIQALGNATVIKKELGNLQDDLSYKIKKQYEDRKDIYEELETLPVTLKNLSTKVDSIQIPSSTGSSVKLEIPKDEQAVVDLTRFMKDGLDQFENIARYYITKQSEFDKSDKLNKSNQDALIESKKVGIKEGKELERINVATEIFNKFPEKFDDVKSVFEDIVTEEYKAGDEIEITQEDRQKLEIKISGIKEVGKITIELPAVLIGGEIVKKATIKEGS